MLPAMLKVMADVLAYRLARLEMANLAAATALLLVLRVPPTDAALRLGFAALLNLLVYLNNDYYDVRLDLQAPGRDAPRVRYLADHLEAARNAQWLLVGALAILASLGGSGLWLALLAGGGVCWAYSARLKRMPYLDVSAMILWGAAMPMCAVPLDSGVGWALLGQLALFSGVFECIQVIRDLPDDRAQGVRTTAVALGERRTRLLMRGLMLAAAAYGLALLHPLTGLLCLAALAVPWGQEVARYWTRIKALFGLAFLVACGQVWLRAEPLGLVWRATTAVGVGGP